MSNVLSTTARMNDFPQNGAVANVWTRILDADKTRRGITIQNQDGAAIFWVCVRKPQRRTEALRFLPNMAIVYDWIAPQNELWIMSDTAGVYLTVSEVFVTERNI